MSEQEFYTQQFNTYRREDSLFIVTILTIMTGALLTYHYFLPLVSHSSKPFHISLFGVSTIGFIPR